MSVTATEWEKLSPEMFEDFVFSLLNREGYLNCAWHARKDKAGRDIVCYKFTVDGPPELFQKYVVLCKTDKNEIDKDALRAEILKAAVHDPYGVILAVNAKISAQKKKSVQELEDEGPFKIVLWSRPDFLESIEAYQDLRSHYLGAAIEDLFKLPALKDVLLRYQVADLSDKVNGLLASVYAKCIRERKPAAVSALLGSYMVDAQDLTEIAMPRDKKFRKEMTEYLEELFSGQPEIDFPNKGIKLTSAFAKTLVLANRLSKKLQRPSLDENVLLYSLFKVPDSDTINSLSEKFSSATVQSIEGTLFFNFDVDEQNTIKQFFADCSTSMALELTEEERTDGDDLNFTNLDFCLDVTQLRAGAGAKKKDLFIVTPERGPEDGNPASKADGEVKTEDEEGTEQHLDGFLIEAVDDGTNRGNRPVRTVAPVRRIPFPSRRPPRLLATYNYQFDMELDNWFSRMVSYLLSHYKKLSDILIFPEKPVQVKSEGKLHEVQLESYPSRFSHFQTEAIACMILNKAIVKGLLAHASHRESISLVFQMKGHQSFRVTIMANAMGVSIAFRKIYPPLWSGKNLFFNDALLSSLLDFEDGIVVVAGKPGSGKTTLISAMVNHVNQNAHQTVVTLENPIETIHTPTCAAIIQLQRGVHFFDYEETAAIAIKSCADLVIVDELRDGQTCRACFESARAGLVTAATISAVSCREAFERILHLCGVEKDDPYTHFLLKSIRRIIHLSSAPDAEAGIRTTLEVVEPSQATEKFEANPGEVETGGDGSAGGRPPSTAAMIDAVFSSGTKREAGAPG